MLECSVLARCSARFLVNREKSLQLINSCDSIFKQSGLLRLASLPEGTSSAARGGTPLVAPAGNAALDYRALQQESPADLSGVHELSAEPAHPAPDAARGTALNTALNTVRRLGIDAVDALLPDGGLPTGRVVELSLQGGAAFGTQIALWTCRAAQREALLSGTDSWCAFIDSSASLYAPGVKATGVDLQRLLVVRPEFADVERVAVRLSEARVFSVIVLDLVGVPWAQTQRGRSNRLEKSDDRSSLATKEERKRRQNWPRTVRQLALKLASTQSQVVLLTDSEVQRPAPLPVALRLQLLSGVTGLDIHVLKDMHGRVGRKGTIPWSEWWGASGTAIPRGTRGEGARAKHLRQPEHVSAVEPKARAAKQPELPLLSSSRLVRTSRASL